MKFHLLLLRWLFLGIKWFIMGTTGLLVFLGITAVSFWVALEIVASKYVWYVIGLFGLILLGYISDNFEVIDDVLAEIQTELEDHGFDLE